MQVSVEESGAIERRLTVCVPGAEVDREIEKRLQDMARRARIPGFRPGKAPRNIVRQRHGARVTDEVVSDTINTSFRKALDQEAIVPASLVSIDPTPFVAGDDLRYVATVEVYPEIPASTLAGRRIEKPVCEIVGEDVERTLEDIRKRHADFVPTQDQSRLGDQLTIDYDGTVDGRALAGGAAKNHRLVLGEGDILEELVAGLLGVKAGESKNIALTFPADYPEREEAGKAAEFAVTVKAVERPVLPECDDALAEKLGIKEGGMAKMREEIELSLNRELAMRMREVMRERVMNALLEVNDIEAPKGLVEAEIDRRVEALRETFTARGVPESKTDFPRERFAEAAKRQVKLGLVVRDIIEKSGIEADGARVRARIEEMAAGYDDAEALINWYYADPARLRPVEGEVLEEQVVAHLLETATVTEKQVSFRELMNPPEAP